MTTNSLVALVALILIGGVVLATPLPSIAPGQAKQQQEGAAAASGAVPPLSPNSLPSTTSSSGEKDGNGAVSKANNNADKLKRGLSNFVNQLNPASFFVPAASVQQPQQQQHMGASVLGDSKMGSNSNANGNNKKPTASAGQQTSGPQSPAEPAALVIGSDQTADVLSTIKGSNRMAHTRPIGGPLRWGR